MLLMCFSSFRPVHWCANPAKAPIKCQLSMDTDVRCDARSVLYKATRWEKQLLMQLYLLVGVAMSPCWEKVHSHRAWRLQKMHGLNTLLIGIVFIPKRSYYSRIPRKSAVKLSHFQDRCTKLLQQKCSSLLSFSYYPSKNLITREI